MQDQYRPNELNKDEDTEARPSGEPPSPSLSRGHLLQRDLQGLAHDLAERLKELNCLYAVSSLVEVPSITRDEVVQGIADLIPPAWQYPDITCARITVEAKQFTSGHFQETPFRQASELSVHGRPLGSLEVFYLEETLERDEGPFLKEERRLLNAIAARLGRIIERFMAEESLRESERRLELALRGADLGLWDWNVQTGEFTLDHRWTEMLGYSLEEIGQVDISFLKRLSHPDDLDKLMAALDNHLAGKTPSFLAETRLRCKSGEWKWFLDRGKIVERDEEGRPLRMTGTHLDITERRKTRMALKQAHEDLEDRVRIRTAELARANELLSIEVRERQRTEAILRSRTEELERTNKDMEQFAYVVAHDLREPLLAVASYLRLLQRTHERKLEGDVERFISGALDSTLWMDSLVQNLLAYSRLGTADQPEEPTDCNVALSRALANLKTAIEEAKATVTSDRLPTVVSQPSHLVQLFQNLLSNAIKFGGDRRPVVHVGVERKEHEWCLFVRDNGIGIDPKHFDRIFLIFQRLHGKTDCSGTGIGLANCRKLVESLGGQIWVESGLGKGSTFLFTIPKKGRSGVPQQL
ncbi:ATP-binding protein [Thermodesulfobacteriota bacterium]